MFISEGNQGSLYRIIREQFRCVFHICIAVFLALLTGASYAQPSVKFEHFSQKEGLSSDNITSIAQDTNGYIWIGTTYGLNRFDGRSFKQYMHESDDSTSLQSNAVFKLLVDSEGILWVGTMEGLDRFDPITEQFHHYNSRLADTLTSRDFGTYSIYQIYEDHEGILWVASWKDLMSYDRSTNTFQQFKFPQDSIQGIRNKGVGAIYEDNKNVLWVSSSKGLYQINPSRSEVKLHRLTNRSLVTIQHINEDALGNLVLGTSVQGLLGFDRESEMFYNYLGQPDRPYALIDVWVRSLYKDRQGILWIGTNYELARYDAVNDLWTSYDAKIGDPNSLSNRLVRSIFEDRQGGIWIGTEKGLNRFDRQSTQFQYLRYDPVDTNGLRGMRLSSVFEDNEGLLWIGSLGKGLHSLDRKTWDFQHYSKSGNDIYSYGWNMINSDCIIEDQNDVLWVGTRQGLNSFNRQSNKFEPHVYSGELPNNFLKEHRVENICEDHLGYIWYGTRYGLCKYDPNTKKLTRYLPDSTEQSGLMSEIINALYITRDSTIWVGASGLHRFDYISEKFIRFQHDPKDSSSLSSDEVVAIIEDSEGTLWIAVKGGLNKCLDRDKGIFKLYNKNQGLNSEAILSQMVEDGHGNLWFGTTRGLTMFDPKAEKFVNYDGSDGLIASPIYSVSKSARTGEMFFTGNGLTFFHPDSIQQNKYVPPVAIASLKYYRLDDPNGRPIELKGIGEKSEVDFSYKDLVIAFEFASLNFHNPKKNQYQYRLEGLNDNWIQLGTNRSVSFAGLSPGNYTLYVKGSNDANVWNENATTLSIVIAPPWWKSDAAYIAYVILIVLGLFGLYRFLMDRKLEQAETHRLKELDSLKTKLYTNITHEFRTPLTVIKGMSEQILDQPRDKQEQSVEMIQRNTHRVLSLVNQMLDLRKLESGELSVNWVRADIIPFLKYVLESFHSLAEAKGVRLHFLSNEETLILDQDQEKLLCITSNLLSNAIKFTADDGDVYFQANASSENGQTKLQLITKDTGIGISSEALPHVFDQFYQADDSSTRRGEGTGIGLTLTRELVHLLGGEISVKSTLGQGTEFVVNLPVRNREGVPAAEEATQLTPSISAPNGAATAFALGSIENTSDLPLVLIIEDNLDVTNYLVSCLGQDYHLITAANGQEGIDKAIDSIPDIIVSDVMMPEKDGFEVCEILKSNERTSHIPIILLTAKAEMQSRIEGLKRGADVYLAKPFNREELIVHLGRLLEQREILRKRYSRADAPSPSEDKGLQLEDAFLKRIQNIMEKHMDDADFGIPQLTRALGMSRSQLFRKLKALTGKSTSLYLRALRLKRARLLLQQGDLNVSEVAYEVGFKDLSYFSRTFTEEFGIAPSATRK